VPTPHDQVRDVLAPGSVQGHATMLPAARFTVAEAARVARHVLTGAAHLHDCRAVHAALSPRRVVRFADGSWRLVGMRRARAYGVRLTPHASRVGFGRIVALHDRASTLRQICEEARRTCL
jgi:hypothetical protein